MRAMIFLICAAVPFHTTMVVRLIELFNISNSSYLYTNVMQLFELSYTYLLSRFL